jgi:hypothetical protein
MMMITSGGDEPDLRDGKDLRRLALTLQVGGVGLLSVMFGWRKRDVLFTGTCFCLLRFAWRAALSVS